jgi:hypothetical protein
MSDLSPQSGPKRTLIRSLSPLAIYGVRALAKPCVLFCGSRPIAALIEPDLPRTVTLATNVVGFLTTQQGVICGLKFG